MKSIIQGIVALAFVFGIATPSYAIIYNVDRTVGAGSVTGFISTDGTIGTLDDANIVDFSLLLDDGTFSVAVNPGNGGTHFTSVGTAFPGPATGSPLVATATELTFDFGSTGFIHFQLDPVDTGTPFWCLTGSASTGHCGGLTGFEVVKTNKDPNIFHSVAFDGRVVVAKIPGPDRQTTNVTEPGTLAILGLGLLGLGIARRRRKI